MDENHGIPVVDRYSAPADMIFHRMDGAVQVFIATWVPGRGWLSTKRSIIYGGRHGKMPTLDEADEDITVLEVRNGLRAMRHALEKTNAKD